MAAGDGASGFTESLSGVSFTSGDAIMLQGTVAASEIKFDAADYGLAQYDGIYVENRDPTHHLEVDLFTDAGSTSLFASGKHLEIAPGACFMIRFDPAQDAILSIGLLGHSDEVEYVMCLAE